jgi:hypothetical protein
MATTKDYTLIYAPKISLRSRALHFLGSLLVGTPASLDMPADFYYIEADREFPAPGQLDWDAQRRRIYVDGFRRALTQRVAFYACVAALVLSIGGALLNGGARGAKNLVQGHGLFGHLTRAECEEQYSAAAQRGDNAEMHNLMNACRDYYR